MGTLAHQNVSDPLCSQQDAELLCGMGQLDCMHEGTHRKEEILCIMRRWRPIQRCNMAPTIEYCALSCLLFGACGCSSIPCTAKMHTICCMNG